MLRNVLVSLFRAGANDLNSPDEMEDLLEDINFTALSQILWDQRETVYEYCVNSGSRRAMEYRGNVLLEQAALLCFDVRDVTNEGAEAVHSLELWLQDDMTLTVISCFRIRFGAGKYETEYRTQKFHNWKEEDMEIDFPALADQLEAMCSAVYRREVPLYEL